MQLCLLKQPLKTQKKLTELEIMYWNAIYICISWYNKSCWFPMKKCWYQQNSLSVSHDSYVSWTLCMIDFRKRGLSPQHPWAALKRPILNRLSNWFKLSRPNVNCVSFVLTNFIFITYSVTCCYHCLLLVTSGYHSVH